MHYRHPARLRVALASCHAYMRSIASMLKAQQRACWRVLHELDGNGRLARAARNPEETRPDEGSILAKWLRTFGASAEYFKHASSIRLRCGADALAIVGWCSREKSLIC